VFGLRSQQASLGGSGSGSLQLRLGLVYVRKRCESPLVQILSKYEGAGIVGDSLIQDLLFGVGAPQNEVIRRQLGMNGQCQRREVICVGSLCQAGGGDGTPYAAPYIGLVGQIHIQRQVTGNRWRRGAMGGGVQRVSVVFCRCCARNRRKVGGARDAGLCSRFLEARESRLDDLIGAVNLGLEQVEFRVPVSQPPRSSCDAGGRLCQLPVSCCAIGCRRRQRRPLIWRG
jgi:hypothetical protein